MGNRRLLSSLSSGVPFFCFGWRSMHCRGCCFLQLDQVVAAERDFDGGEVGVPVVLDLEMERLEQATQDWLGQLVEASSGGGKRVQEVKCVDIDLPFVQSGQLSAPLFELAVQLVELLADLGEQLALFVLLVGKGGGQPLLL